MQDFEFLKYELTPGDKYGMLGVATIRERRYSRTGEQKTSAIHRFKKITKKDGSGEFFVGGSFGINRNGETKYEASFELDSNIDNTMFKEWLHDASNSFEAKRSTFSRENPQGSVATGQRGPESNNYYTPDLSTAGSAAEEQLPF